MPKLARLNVCVIVFCLIAFSVSAAQSSGAPTDPFMGDWRGTLKGAHGAERQICAQVICWGREGYQANLLDAFDQRIKPIAVLKGKPEDGKVVFGDSAIISEEQFKGKLTGERAGSFTMKHIVRLSPTLGAKPPEGAIILFDGTNLDEWEGQMRRPWILNLAKLIGGSDRAVYLRSRVWCPKGQPALLELGSDDAVNVWLNGAQVHANNVFRALKPWEDKVNIELKEGWNTLMLEVIQGGGDWSACARIRSGEGKDIDGLRFDPAPKLDEGKNVKSLQGESTGTIVTWELAGPYTEEGKKGSDLFEASFAPEKEAAAGVEWRIVNDKPAPALQWRLVEGDAMEVTPGTGSIVSEGEFKDHKIHIEFRTPFQANARGQGRGNSGVYVQRRYEVQVLDSYGLEGRKNECGALYGRAAPRVNMCAPPLQWQTYDIEFYAARFNEKENKMEDATINVRHNGVLVHENFKIPFRGKGKPGFVASGGILLQDHGNRVRYRNIWVVEQ